MPLPQFDQIGTAATRQETGGVLSDAKNFLGRVGLNLPNTPADILNAFNKNINAIIQPKENQANVNYSVPTRQLPQAQNHAEQFADITMQGLVPAIAQFAVALPIAEAAIPEATTVGGEMLRQALAQGVVSAGTSASEGRDAAVEQGLIGAGLGLTSAIPRLARLPLNAALLGGAAQLQVNQGADPVVAYGQAGGMLFGSMLPKALKPQGKLASLQTPEAEVPPSVLPSESPKVGPLIDQSGVIHPAETYTPDIAQDKIPPHPYLPDIAQDRIPIQPDRPLNTLDNLNSQLRNQESWQENGALNRGQKDEAGNPVKVGDLNPNAVNLGEPNFAATQDMHETTQQHGLIYLDQVDDKHVFLDPQNGKAFGVQDGSNGQQLSQQLADHRLQFASLQTPEDLVTKLKEVYSSLADHPAVPDANRATFKDHLAFLDSLSKDGAKLSPDDLGKLNTMLTETHVRMKQMANFYEETHMANPFEKQRAALRDVGGVEIPEHPIIPAVKTDDGTIVSSPAGHMPAWDKAMDIGLSIEHNALNAEIAFENGGWLTDRGRFVNRDEGHQLAVDAGLPVSKKKALGLVSEDMLSKPLADTSIVMRPKFDQLSSWRLKSNSNLAGMAYLRTMVALGGGSAAGLAEYSESKGDWEKALGVGLLSTVALMFGTGVLEKVLRVSPEALKNIKEPIKALPKEELASLQKADYKNNAMHQVLVNLSLQNTNTGRGGLLAKAIDLLRTQIGMGSPEFLRTMKMEAAFAVDKITRACVVAQDKLNSVTASDFIKERVGKYVKGQLVPEGDVKSIIASEGGMAFDDPMYGGASKATKAKLDNAWRIGDFSDPNTKVYAVSSETKAKLVKMENDALFASLQNQSDIDYAKWGQIARQGFSSLQEMVVHGMPDSNVSNKIFNSIDQHVIRAFEFFTHGRMPTDEEVTAMAHETIGKQQQSTIDRALANSTAYHLHDTEVETPIIKDGVQVGTEKSQTSGYDSLHARYAKNENYDLYQRMEQLVPLEHKGETLMVHPDVKESYAAQGDIEDSKGIVMQYLHDSQKEGMFAGHGSKETQGLDTTLIKTRQDLGPAWRKGLGEFTDPIEMMNAAFSRITPMAKAANFIYEASSRDIHGLPGVLDQVEWVKAKSKLQNEIADAKQAGQTKIVASLQSKFNELMVYKKGITDIKFGLLKDQYVNPYIYEQFKSYNALTKDTTNPMGYYVTEVNRNFKKFHTAYNNVGLARNYVQTIPLVLAAKGNLMDLPEVWRILHDTEHPLYHEYQNVSSATFANAELGFKLHDMISGKTDSDFVASLKKVDRFILNAYNLPDALGRGMVYMNALRAASKDLNLPTSHPSVKTAALEHTNKFYLNFDGVAPAVRWARNIPFFSLYVGWTSEITRIAKNHIIAAMHGDMHSMASLAAIVAIPEIAQYASEQSMSDQDRKEWEQVKAGLPSYAKDRYYVNIRKDENGNYRYTDVTSLLVNDSYAMLGRAIKRGDAVAFMENNPLVGWENSPAFTLATEQITGKNIHTFQDFREGNMMDRITAAVQVVAPPLTPYFGYEWNKVMSTGITNQSTGKTETLEGWLTRWTTGANVSTYNPAVIQRRMAQDTTAKIDLESQYLKKVLQTTAPEATKQRAYDNYQQAVACALAEYQAKLNIANH